MKVQLPKKKSPFLWLGLQAGYHRGKKNPIIVEYNSIMLSFSQVKGKGIYSFFKKGKKKEKTDLLI